MLFTEIGPGGLPRFWRDSPAQQERARYEDTRAFLVLLVLNVVFFGGCWLLGRIL